MNFVFGGFRQSNEIRQYLFDGIAEDRTQSAFTVTVDLALARRYQIPVQELPLVCRRALELPEDSGRAHAVVFAEQDMIAYVSSRVAAREAALLKKKPRAVV